MLGAGARGYWERVMGREEVEGVLLGMYTMVVNVNMAKPTQYC